MTGPSHSSVTDPNPRIHPRIPRQSAYLTPFERRLLEFLAAGKNRREIAVNLKVSPQTVSHALTVAKEKLGARTIVEAVVFLILEVAS